MKMELYYKMSKILKLQKIESEVSPSLDRNLSTLSVGICSTLPTWSLNSLFVC